MATAAWFARSMLLATRFGLVRRVERRVRGTVASDALDHKAEWFIAGVLTPTFVMLLPVYKTWRISPILSAGELFVLAIVLASSMVWSNMFRMKRKEHDGDWMFWHTVLAFFALLFLMAAYISRFDKEGNIVDLSQGWVLVSLLASILTVVLGLLMPSPKARPFVLRIGAAD